MRLECVPELLRLDQRSDGEADAAGEIHRAGRPEGRAQCRRRIARAGERTTPPSPSRAPRRILPGRRCPPAGARCRPDAMPGAAAARPGPDRTASALTGPAILRSRANTGSSSALAGRTTCVRLRSGRRARTRPAGPGRRRRARCPGRSTTCAPAPVVRYRSDRSRVLGVEAGQGPGDGLEIVERPKLVQAESGGDLGQPEPPGSIGQGDEVAAHRRRPARGRPPGGERRSAPDKCAIAAREFCAWCLRMTWMPLRPARSAPSTANRQLVPPMSARRIVGWSDTAMSILLGCL